MSKPVSPYGRATPQPLDTSPLGSLSLLQPETSLPIGPAPTTATATPGWSQQELKATPSPTISDTISSLGLSGATATFPPRSGTETGGFTGAARAVVSVLLGGSRPPRPARPQQQQQSSSRPGSATVVSPAAPRAALGSVTTRSTSPEATAVVTIPRPPPPPAGSQSPRAAPPSPSSSVNSSRDGDSISNTSDTITPSSAATRAVARFNKASTGTVTTARRQSRHAAKPPVAVASSNRAVAPQPAAKGRSALAYPPKVPDSRSPTVSEVRAKKAAVPRNEATHTPDGFYIDMFYGDVFSSLKEKGGADAGGNSKATADAPPSPQQRQARPISRLRRDVLSASGSELPARKNSAGSNGSINHPIDAEGVSSTAPGRLSKSAGNVSRRSPARAPVLPAIVRSRSPVAPTAGVTTTTTAAAEASATSPVRHFASFDLTDSANSSGFVSSGFYGPAHHHHHSSHPGASMPRRNSATVAADRSGRRTPGLAVASEPSPAAAAQAPANHAYRRNSSSGTLVSGFSVHQSSFYDLLADPASPAPAEAPPSSENARSPAPHPSVSLPALGAARGSGEFDFDGLISPFRPVALDRPNSAATSGRTSRGGSGSATFTTADHHKQQPRLAAGGTPVESISESSSGGNGEDGDTAARIARMSYDSGIYRPGSDYNTDDNDDDDSSDDKDDDDDDDSGGDDDDGDSLVRSYASDSSSNVTNSSVLGLTGDAVAVPSGGRPARDADRMFSGMEGGGFFPIVSHSDDDNADGEEPRGGGNLYATPPPQTSNGRGGCSLETSLRGTTSAAANSGDPLHGTRRRLLPLDHLRALYLVEAFLGEDDVSQSFRVRERRNTTSRLKRRFTARFFLSDKGSNFFSRSANRNWTARCDPSPALTDPLTEQVAIAMLVDHPAFTRSFDFFYNADADARRIATKMRGILSAGASDGSEEPAAGGEAAAGGHLNPRVFARGELGVVGKRASVVISGALLSSASPDPAGRDDEGGGCPHDKLDEILRKLHDEHGRGTRGGGGRRRGGAAEPETEAIDLLMNRDYIFGVLISEGIIGHSRPVAQAEQCGGLDEATVANCAREICDGLRYLHRFHDCLPGAAAAAAHVDFARGPSSSAFRPSLIHGNLRGELILVDGGGRTRIMRLDNAAWLTGPTYFTLGPGQAEGENCDGTLDSGNSNGNGGTNGGMAALNIPAPVFPMDLTAPAVYTPPELAHYATVLRSEHAKQLARRREEFAALPDGEELLRRAACPSTLSYSSFNYASPKLREHLVTRFSPAADAYQLGVTLYRLLVGAAPVLMAPEGHPAADWARDGRKGATVCRAVGEQVYLEGQLRYAALSPAARDLLARLILHPQEMRPTMDEVLAHPFITRQ